MRLPIPLEKYTPSVESDRNRILETADSQNRKIGADVDLAGGNATRKPRLILTASDGSRWSVVVSTTGVLSTVAA